MYNPSMSDHPIHTAEEHLEEASGFELWPYTQATDCPISDVNIAHEHDFFVVQYVTEGSGTQVIDFQPHRIAPQHMYFVSPRQLHLWQPDGELKGYIMAFTEEFLNTPDSPFGSVADLHFFHSLASSPVLPVDGPQGENIVNLLRQLSEEFMAKRPGYLTALRALFHVFLVNVQRAHAEAGSEGAGREPLLVRQFKQMAASSYAEQLPIQEYADRLGVSVSRLNNVIKENTDQTPGQIVRGELVLAAKRLLAHSDRNVAEICYDLNFEDPSYFGRFFKRETGLTPSAFRDTMLEKYQLLAR